MLLWSDFTNPYYKLHLGMTMRSLPFLLLACLALLFMAGEADAASPVSISADQTYSDILEGGMVVTTLTIESSDTEFRKQEVYLVANWPSNTTWPTLFTDTNFDEIPNNEVALTKAGTTTVFLTIFCYDECTSGDSNVVQIYAKTDPRFYDGGNNTDTCGSDDCETDTSPASASSNVTNTITLNFIARTGFMSSLSCDTVSSAGDNQLSQNITSLWNYTLTNTGWNTDSYQFTSIVTSADGNNVDYWNITPGMLNGKELTGQSDSSSTAVHTAEGSISITPATNATSGIYNVELTVISNNGGQDSSCTFDVVIPAEEEPDDEPEEEVVEDETISISVNVPMKPDHIPNYPDVTEITDLQVEWDSMDIATGENFTFTFIADNLVDGTEYAFSYVIYSSRGDTLGNASHLFIANNTGEYSYNLEGQFLDDGDWYYNCTRVQAMVSFVKNPNSDNGILEELASFSTNQFYASGHKYDVCDSPVGDPGFHIPSISLVSSIAAVAVIALRRRY